MAAQPGQQVCEIGGLESFRIRRHQRGHQTAHAPDVLAQEHLLDAAGLDEGETGGAFAFQKSGEGAAIARLHESCFVARPDPLVGHEDVLQQRFLRHAKLAEQVRAHFVAFVSDAMTRRAGLPENFLAVLQVARPRQGRDEFAERLLANLFDGR